MSPPAPPAAPPQDTLLEVGEYRVPMKLVLPSGERAILGLNILST